MRMPASAQARCTSARSGVAGRSEVIDLKCCAEPGRKFGKPSVSIPQISLMKPCDVPGDNRLPAVRRMAARNGAIANPLFFGKTVSEMRSDVGDFSPKNPAIVDVAVHKEPEGFAGFLSGCRTACAWFREVPGSGGA
jgi:hypothetical protein